MHPDASPPIVATINAGSSSIKIALFHCVGEPVRVMEGSATAFAEVLSAFTPLLAGRPLTAVAHRIVHGGPHFRQPCVITEDVLAALHALVPLAPNHLPKALALVQQAMVALPGVPQIACFDTAFFRDLPAVAHTLPLPPGDDLVPIERYGFHGLSYEYLLSRLDSVGGAGTAQGRVVLAHLGSGASLSAVRASRCLDTTMGLTPLGGVVMSTRPGDLDPGAVTYMMRTRGWSAAEVDDALAHRAGLAAVSGGTGDMKTLLERESNDERARLAVDLFCYQIRKCIGAFAAALEGIDTLVFSGGIGEHAAAVRARILTPLRYLGVTLDTQRNAANDTTISVSDSRVPVFVIPTNEALVMARHARDLI